MVEVFSSKEKFLTEMDELRTQLDERSKKIDALWVQNSRILDQIEGGGFDPCLPLNDKVRVVRAAAVLERWGRRLEEKRRREEDYVEHLVMCEKQAEECQELRKVIKYVGEGKEELLALWNERRVWKAKHRKIFGGRIIKKSGSWTKESLKKKWSFWRKAELEEMMKERRNVKVEEGRDSQE